jgi:hypothetical protein
MLSASRARRLGVTMPPPGHAARDREENHGAGPARGRRRRHPERRVI